MDTRIAVRGRNSPIIPPPSFRLPSLPSGPVHPYGSGTSAPTTSKCTTAYGGPLGITPEPSRKTTIREREERAEERYATRFADRAERERFHADRDSQIRDWITRLLATEQGAKASAQAVAQMTTRLDEITQRLDATDANHIAVNDRISTVDSTMTRGESQITTRFDEHNNALNACMIRLNHIEQTIQSINRRFTEMCFTNMPGQNMAASSPTDHVEQPNPMATQGPSRFEIHGQRVVVPPSPTGLPAFGSSNMDSFALSPERRAPASPPASPPGFGAGGTQPAADSPSGFGQGGAQAPTQPWTRGHSPSPYLQQPQAQQMANAQQQMPQTNMQRPMPQMPDGQNSVQQPYVHAQANLPNTQQTRHNGFVPVHQPALYQQHGASPNSDPMPAPQQAYQCGMLNMGYSQPPVPQAMYPQISTDAN